MRVLVVSQYFWPESFAINELVKTLSEQGHSVVVATGKPNYPDGEIFEGYQAGGAQIETFDGTVPVVRVPLRPRGKSGGLGLLLNYASFVYSGLRRFPSLLAPYEVDAIVVFAVSPITAALPAILLKRAKKAHLAIWVQDLWPESLAATGYIRSRPLLSLAGVMVRIIYGLADTLLVQSHAFVEPVARYARRDKIVYYPNSSKRMPEADAADVTLPSELSAVLANRFAVVFAGNIGRVQAIPTVIEAAVRLKAQPGIAIVLIGNGSLVAWARVRQQELALDNLLLVDRLPSTAMPAVYRKAGALLVTLNDQQALAHTVPSKVQGYLAAGRPIVAALPGEGARVVAESGAGLTCAPEDPAALADTIESMYRLSAAERRRMGESGKRYFSAQFDMDNQARRLVDILEERIAAVGPRS